METCGLPTLRNDAIGNITGSGQVQEFALPAATPTTNNINTLEGISEGPDGNVWFVGYTFGGNVGIGKITAAGQVSEYAIGGTTVGIGNPTAQLITNTGSSLAQ